MRGEHPGKHAAMKEVGLLYFSDSRPLLLSCDITLQAHLLEDLLHAHKGAVRVHKWIASDWRAGNTGEHGGLGKLELRRGSRPGPILETKVNKFLRVRRRSLLS